MTDTLTRHINDTGIDEMLQELSHTMHIEALADFKCMLKSHGFDLSIRTETRRVEHQEGQQFMRQSDRDGWVKRTLIYTYLDVEENPKYQYTSPHIRSFVQYGIDTPGATRGTE